MLRLAMLRLATLLEMLNLAMLLETPMLETLLEMLRPRRVQARLLLEMLNKLSKARPLLAMLNWAKLLPEMLNRVSKPSKEPPSARAPTQPSFLVQLLPPLLLEPLLETPMPEPPLAMLPLVTHSRVKQQLAMLNRDSKPSKEPPSARAPTQPSFLVQLLPPLLLEPLLETPMPELPLAMLEPQSKARVPLQAMPILRLRTLRRRIRR
jgi:hypothetical protein